MAAEGLDRLRSPRPHRYLPAMPSSPLIRPAPCRPSRPRTLAAIAIAFLAACGTDHDHVGTGGPASPPHPTRTDTGSTCIGPCDASAPSIPVVTDTLSHGDVTTYGGVGNTVPSTGGACNYGVTGITHYAAIQVSQAPGDLTGQWDGGRACGQCYEVRARTPTGWRTTHVRIVDKCPDGFCGIDLGGAPATDLMGPQAGRYSGEWRPIPCAGLEGVSDGPMSIDVKDGSSTWWSLVQVRNPPSAVSGIRLRADHADAAWESLAWAIEAENFFKVPADILQDSVPYEIEVSFRMADPVRTTVSPAALATPGSIPLP